MKFGKVVSLGLLAVAAVSVLVGWLVWRWVETTPRQQNANSTAAAQAHEFYGALYDAAWRGDEGVGEATMSATLFTPGLKTALINDPLKSTLDAQVAATFDAETKDQIAVLIGMDAVVGSSSARLPDTTLRQALTFTVADDTATIADLIPLVVTDLPTTNTPSIQRRWVALFTPANAVDWTATDPMRLTVKDIGQIPTRTFTWANPALLNDLAATD